MRKIALIAAAAALTFGSSMASADGAALYAAKGCSACHGPDAKSPVMPVYPKLAGQSAAYALQQMKDIKSGARANGMAAAMKAIIAGVSEDEMKQIADWLSSL
jgi:cytochrome c